MLLPPNNYAFTSAPHFSLLPIKIVTKCALKLTICNKSPLPSSLRLLPKETTFLPYIFVFSNLFVTFAPESKHKNRIAHIPAKS